MNNKREIEIRSIDKFKPHLYADLYIPSIMNGYSISLEFIYNWFLSKFPKNIFKTIHVVNKSTVDDFRRFEYGDYMKREKPAVSFLSSINFEHDFSITDMYMLGIDTYMKRSNYNKSFFKDPERGLYMGHVAELLECNFTIRCRFNTKSEQLDFFKRMELMFRIGCTETFETDMDFHIPYELIADVARDNGYHVDNDGIILQPYLLLKYLNKYSQIPILYKLRYINGRHEFFMRMINIPFYIDTKNKIEIDDGEQDGQTQTNFHLELQLRTITTVPKFYVYYAEEKVKDTIKTVDLENLNVYSMKVVDIPDINYKGWVQYATSNYIREENEDLKSIDISSLFKAPFDIMVDISLDDLITDACSIGISPSSFIDIQIYGSDIYNMQIIPTKMDWINRKIILPSNISDNYFYLVVYTDRGYVNDKIIDKNNVYKNRVTMAKKDKFESRTVDITPVIQKDKGNGDGF